MGKQSLVSVSSLDLLKSLYLGFFETINGFYNSLDVDGYTLTPIELKCSQGTIMYYGRTSHKVYLLTDINSVSVDWDHSSSMKFSNVHS